MATKENAKATDGVSVAGIEPDEQDPTVIHHLAQLRAMATELGKAQRKVLAAWEIDGEPGGRVLVVQPSGSFKVTES